MSQAFVKEEDSQWLHDVAPTINALIHFLTRENNGVRVYEQKTFFHSKNDLQAFCTQNSPEKRDLQIISNIFYAPKIH